MKNARWLGAALALALTLPASPAHAFALRLKGEGWAYGFAERNAYFAAGDNYAWIELMLRAQATLELGDHVVLEARGVGETTLGHDYFFDGNEAFKGERYYGRVDLASLNLERLLDGKLTVKLGRQEIIYGEGFLVGDGYDEYGNLLYRQAKVAELGTDSRFGGTGQWTIPVKSWDAARVSLDLEPVTLDFMVSRLDPTVIEDPAVPPGTVLPGIVAAADGEWSGESVSVGVTGVHHRLMQQAFDLGLEPSQLTAASLRTKWTPGDWKIEAEVVAETGRDADVDRRALGARLNARHTWSMNPYSPWVRGSLYYFSGDDPDTEVNEAYDSLFYDWSDFGRWYLGDISAAEFFGNSDQLVAELGVGFQPTPLQNVKLLFYGIASQTGVGTCELLECEEGTVGAGKPLVAETNLIWDWAPAEVGKWKPDGRFYFGAMAGAAVPLGPMKELAGDAVSLEGMLFMTVNL
jgi:hypothetical protein